MSEVIVHKETSQSVLKVLLYYDIFHYPLTSEEVFEYLSTNHVTPKDVLETLDELSCQGYIFKYENFYSVRDSREIIDRRIKGNQEAKKWIYLAEKQARLIHSFPFVRAVMVSGSLSKNYMDEKSDLDFFIITAPQRLWIARTLLVIYKKILLSNSHKHFCVNYFIDSSHLEIEEKNIFTATELATLIPFCGYRYYKKLFYNNRWLNDFFPNHHPRSINNDTENNRGLKAFSEKIINALGGEWLDKVLMKITNRRWRKIYADKYSIDDFLIAFKTTRHESKNHPNYYQKKVVNQYIEKLIQFAGKFNIHWIHE